MKHSWRMLGIVLLFMIDVASCVVLWQCHQVAISAHPRTVHWLTEGSLDMHRRTMGMQVQRSALLVSDVCGDGVCAVHGELAVRDPAGDAGLAAPVL